MEQTLAFVDYFKTTPQWATMVATVEDSPWHREANVGVHTEMAIAHYISVYAPHRTDYQNKLGILSLLFHDTGKPSAEEVVTSETRGTYRRYAGHEQDSAVCFTEFFLQDAYLQSLVTVEDARKIRWIIEHHLPFGFKDPTKRAQLRTAIAHTLREDEETFFDHVRSDAAGRISDGHPQKLQDVEDWFAEFKKVPFVVNKVNASMGKCYVLIGPSGSGKSTWREQYKNENARIVSLDTYRLVFFNRNLPMPINEPMTVEDVKQDYRDAYSYCLANEAAFNKFVDEQIKAAFDYARETRADVFVDNTNGSKKSRAKWIQLARNIGMKVIAVEFWHTLATLTARQKSRDDKEVPYSSLKQQYFAQTCAWHGSEVDEVIVVPGT
jgi:predicted kinase